MNTQHFEYKTYSPAGSICVNNICSPDAISRLTVQRTPAPSPVPTTITGQFTLYHFMDRWTCSSCWRLTKALGQMQEWLAVHGVTVVLVGQSHYIQQANKLAKDLLLPFRLVNDEHGSLQRLYGFGECVNGIHHQTLALVDKKGRVRYWQQAQDSDKGRQVSTLRTAVEHLRTK
jgi:peroxiredoxin